MIGPLLTAGFLLLGIGMLSGLLLPPGMRRLRPLPYLLAAGGSALLATTGGFELASGAAYTIHASLIGLGLGHPAGLLDHLAALFLLIACATALAISVSAAGWSLGTGGMTIGEYSRMVPGSYCLLILAVAGVILSANAFDFVFSWELVTVGVALLVLSARKDSAQMRSSWLAAFTGKGSGAMLLAGVLLLAANSGSLTMVAFGTGGSGTVTAIAWLLCATAFAMKMGIVPFHPWMPAAYPQAPAPARALMAGVALNVGVYGLWRFLDILGAPPAGLVAAILILGGISALIGIAFGSVEKDLARFISWSSVENAGIIFVAFGVACAGEIGGSHIVVAAGLLAATLQCVAHAFGKSLLFASSSRLECACQSTNLDSIRGVARRLPVTGVFFSVGCLSLAGMPPLAGFVSEWFVMESLAQLFRLHGLLLPLSMGIAGAFVALTAGIAGFAFVRLLGLSVAGGMHGSREVRSASGILTGAGTGALSICLLGLSIATPLEIRVIASGISGIVARHDVMAAIASPFVVEPAAPGYSVLSPSWLWLVFLLMGLLVTAFTVIMSRGRFFRARVVQPWQSAATATGIAGEAGGLAGVAVSAYGSGETGYTSYGYANIMRHVMAMVLRSEKEISGLHDVAPESSTPGSSAPAPGTPGSIQRREIYRTQPRYSHEVKDPVVAYLYLPLRQATLRVARTVQLLQSGRINAYIAYMLIVLLSLLVVIRILN
ncbi:MAG: proton-conducting transporter transmembrane domain-containing protein [Acidimicrobiales bacterium]